MIGAETIVAEEKHGSLFSKIASEKGPGRRSRVRSENSQVAQPYVFRLARRWRATSPRQTINGRRSNNML